MLQCPLCESRTFMRDYASPRPYILLGLGVLLLVAGHLILPAFFPLFQLLGHDLNGIPYMNAFVATAVQIKWFGIACAVIGFFDRWRDKNRFCLRCGLKVRHPDRTLDAATKAVLKQRSVKPDSKPGRLQVDPAGRGRLLASRQPIGPLIKMLKLRNDSMRADAAATLKELTGQAFGDDYDAWLRWWAENKATYSQS